MKKRDNLFIGIYRFISTIISSTMHNIKLFVNGKKTYWASILSILASVILYKRDYISADMGFAVVVYCVLEITKKHSAERKSRSVGNLI